MHGQRFIFFCANWCLIAVILTTTTALILYVFLCPLQTKFSLSTFFVPFWMIFGGKQKLGVRAYGAM